MRATEIEPGDVLTDPDTGRTIYTVLDTRPLDGGIVVGVRYEVDGGTGLRYFAPDQDVPLTRVRPINPSEPSTIEQRRAARAALRRAEEAAAEAKDTLHGLRSRGAAAHVTAAAEIVYRDACRAEDDAALVVDRLNQSQMSGLGDPDLSEHLFGESPTEPPTAEDYAEAGLPGLAPMPTLTERLAEAVSSPALGAQANEARTDRAVRAVAGWLRARDNEHGDNRLAELADLIERGEA